MRVRLLALLALAFLSSITLPAFAETGAAGSAPKRGWAPVQLAGFDVVLTIERTQSTLPGGYPTMGAVVQTYAADGTYRYRGFGGPNHLAGHGTYTFTKTGPNSAREEAMQSSDFFTLPYRMEYTFEAPDAGRWIQHFADGLIVFEGTFVIARTDAGPSWAPTSLEGQGLVLSGKQDGRPLIGLVQYASETYTSCVLARTLTSSSGSYTAQRLARRSLVEEGAAANGHQYVRVYVFDHPHRGGWRETDVATGVVTRGKFRVLH